MEDRFEYQKQGIRVEYMNVSALISFKMCVINIFLNIPSPSVGLEKWSRLTNQSECITVVESSLGIERGSKEPFRWRFQIGLGDTQMSLGRGKKWSAV